MNIEFIERVYPDRDMRDALLHAREAFVLMVDGGAGDSEELVSEISYIYPKLRFAWLSMQRYEFAARYLRDDDFVLDAPCGTGFGSAILARNGNKVLGIDIDGDSIAYASDMYRYPNVQFEVADMMVDNLPGVDFITCLDGLEHVTPGHVLIERFVSSLSDRGILVVSVPINELKITGGERNPYHKEDYDPESLYDLLSPYFKCVSMYGHDLSGSISGIGNAFDGITAVCEV